MDVRALVEGCYARPPAQGGPAAGVPEGHSGIRTLGALLEAGCRPLPSREQVRGNLIARRRRGEPCYPGILGLGGDVLPALDRALLAGHDVFLVGQIGQAKTRIARTVAETLLSPVPVVRGSLTSDCPLDLPAAELAAALEGSEPPPSAPAFHVSPESLEAIRDGGLGTPLEWREGRDRYRYVLATPDLSVRDLVGYVDAIKVAKRGAETYSVESYSPGQLMQAKHGILCIDELPVLDPRKQVSLLSVLQEGRFTTGSYPVYFEPRTVLFATANPVDYTHSGRVVEPLFDRLRSHVRTRYPDRVDDEMMIILQEARLHGARVPEPVLRALAVLAHRMRRSGEVSQERGVSVRLGIHGLEAVAAEAERVRPPGPGGRPVPRPSDLHAVRQAAKFELSEADDTQENRDRVLGALLAESVREVALASLGEPAPGLAESVRAEFSGREFRVSQEAAWDGGPGSYGGQAAAFPALSILIAERAAAAGAAQAALARRAASLGIGAAAAEFGPGDAGGLRAAVAELVLEGLRWTTPKALDRRDSGYVPA